MRKTYFRLHNRNCILNPDTGVWKIELPQEFVNSRYVNKAITVLNFQYTCGYTTSLGSNFQTKLTEAIDYTTLHSPTLCDGNFNQNNYICMLCYNYNSVYKTYPIRSNPQYMEFYFKDTADKVVKTFIYAPGASGHDTYWMEERFNIDLELIY